MLGLRSSAIRTLVEHILRFTLLLHLSRRCAMHYADYLLASFCLSDGVGADLGLILRSRGTNENTNGPLRQ